jgi:hypothetical protein
MALRSDTIALLDLGTLESGPGVVAGVSEVTKTDFSRDFYSFSSCLMVQNKS